MKDDIISHWKDHIQSKDKIQQLDALQEIVSYLNESSDKNYVNFINSDLNYFLSEMLIYQHRAATILVIKIVCHLSEIQEFFKNDFFRFIKSSLRLINSFSNDFVSNHIVEEADYKRSILGFNTMILRRAQEFNVNFEDNRFPKLSLMITASSLISLDSKIIEKLDFVSATLDVFQSFKFGINDRIYQEKKLIEILKNLKICKEDLQSVDYFVLAAKLLHNIINFLPATNECDDQILVNLITEKFIIAVRFTLHDSNNIPKISYGIFLNLFYYIFTSNALANDHYKILNYFLSLNGFNFLLHMVNRSDISPSGKKLEFKARVVLAEIMLHFLKIFLEANGNDENVLREKYLKIALNCDITQAGFELENVTDLSTETLLFIIFKYYVLSKWNKMTKRKGELLTSMAFIIEVFKSRKKRMDKGIASMLLYIYTSNFVNIKVKKNDLLEMSSATLTRYIGKINIIVDLNFFKWWFFQNWKDKKLYEKLLMYLISSKSCEKFMNLREEDLFPFDIKLMLQIFFNDKTPIENLEKLTRIICKFLLNFRDFEKLLNFYEKHRTAQDRRRSIYALKIVCANRKKFNVRMQKKMCELARKTLAESTNMQERLLAVQLFTNLIYVVK